MTCEFFVCPEAKFQGESFVLIEEEHFEELGIPPGASRLHLEDLIKEVSNTLIQWFAQQLSRAKATFVSTAPNSVERTYIDVINNF